MNKHIFTFGSNQLQTIKHKLNPMSVMLVLNAKSEPEARQTVFNSFIGKNFCTSYPESYIQEFKDKYNMKEYTLKELEKLNDTK